ncbi:hypothetical protein KPL71_000728 [Citrus sinensis]|uniref:Uncharacterized protein n=1 Tax=Citrus sinensis TaxID=2711 RepID=A0ACB8NR30_CITSI|nr:hypothetical protein KPL71_000728 [Citrus sinensis]
MPSGIIARLPTSEDLEAYAIGQWELMDTNAQLWYIVREYISNSQVWLLIFFSVVSLHQNFCASLSLIHWIEYQLPNLIVGATTKESLNNAFENGITAEQQNAHPRVADRIPSIPENVCDQIRLWESDLNRVEMTPAHYYDEFPSRDVFEAACDYARDRSGLL